LLRIIYNQQIWIGIEGISILIHDSAFGLRLFDPGRIGK
jgi:hypothetical protein